MAKPNYQFAKRQRDLAKKQKKEEKRLRKAAQGEQPLPNLNEQPQDGPPVEDTTAEDTAEDTDTPEKPTA